MLYYYRANGKSGAFQADNHPAARIKLLEILKNSYSGRDILFCRNRVYGAPSYTLIYI